MKKKKTLILIIGIIILLILFFFPKISIDPGPSFLPYEEYETFSCKCFGFEARGGTRSHLLTYCSGIPHSCSHEIKYPRNS